MYDLAEDKTAIDDIKNLISRELFKNFDAFRLGTKGEHLRPIKQRFSDKNSTRKFVKRANLGLTAEGIFCKLDVNAKIRGQEFQLREEIECSNNNTELETS